MAHWRERYSEFEFLQRVHVSMANLQKNLASILFVKILKFRILQTCLGHLLMVFSSPRCSATGLVSCALAVALALLTLKRKFIIGWQDCKVRQMQYGHQLIETMNSEQRWLKPCGLLRGATLEDCTYSTGLIWGVLGMEELPSNSKWEVLWPVGCRARIKSKKYRTFFKLDA